MASARRQPRERPACVPAAGLSGMCTTREHAPHHTWAGGPGLVGACTASAGAGAGQTAKRGTVAHLCSPSRPHVARTPSHSRNKHPRTAFSKFRELRLLVEPADASDLAGRMAIQRRAAAAASADSREQEKPEGASVGPSAAPAAGPSADRTPAWSTGFHRRGDHRTVTATAGEYSNRPAHPIRINAHHVPGVAHGGGVMSKPTSTSPPAGNCAPRAAGPIHSQVPHGLIR